MLTCYVRTVDSAQTSQATRAENTSTAGEVSNLFFKTSAWFGYLTLSQVGKRPIDQSFDVVMLLTTIPREEAKRII